VHRYKDTNSFQARRGFKFKEAVKTSGEANETERKNDSVKELFLGTRRKGSGLRQVLPRHGRIEDAGGALYV